MTKRWLGLAAFLLAPNARADDVAVGVFAPTPTTTGSTGFQLEAPEVGASGDWVASAMVSYATDLLIVDTTVNSETAIARRMMFSVGGAYAFLDRFEAGLTLPMYSQRGDGIDGMFQFAEANGAALGDLLLHGKVRIVRRADFVVGAALRVTLPTSSAGQFTGLDLPSVRALGLASWQPTPRITLSANAGGVARQTSVFRDSASISQGSGLVWGVGSSLRVLDALWLTAELFGERVSSGRNEQGGNTLALSPIEGLVGASFRPRHDLTIGVAGGRGLSNGIGAPDLRGVVSVSFAPGAVVAPLPRRTEVIVDVPVVVPDPATDRDGDRVVDARDKCPTEPEDPDGFADADGCPELDNDADGIADRQDGCPNQAETVNGKDDHDGCPDEGDMTGVAIVGDQSPQQAANDTFERGRTLMANGKYAEACAAFEQSQLLDPQYGTQFNLAGCYEKLGKLASAWTLYRELSRSDSNPTRRTRSTEITIQLAARVPKLKLVLSNKPAGVQVFMNDVNVNAFVGLETPVDSGTYRIVVGATGYRGWRQSVVIKEERKVVTVVINLEHL